MVMVIAAVVAVRLHEFVPGIGVIKPVLTISVGGMIMLASRTAPYIRAAVPRTPIARMVFTYFGFMLITIPSALWRGGAIDMARSMLPAIILFAAFLMTPPTRSNLDRLLFGYVMLILFFSWYVQFFGGSWAGRLISISGSFDSNDISSLLSMALPLSIGLFMRASGRRERIGSVLAILALVLGVIATGSRGGFLAMVAGLFIFVIGLRGEARFIAPIFMVIAGAIFWFTAPPRFRDRIQSLAHLEKDYNLTAEAGRKAVWARGRQYIMEHPLTGVGAGNFFVAEGGFNIDVGRTGKWSAAHNAYIQAYAELGIPGGSVFVLMLLTAAGVAFRMWGPPRARSRAPPERLLYRPEFLASITSYSVGAYFLSHAYFHPLFAILGLVALAERVMQAEAQGIYGGEEEVTAAPAPIRSRGERGGLSWLPAASASSARAALRDLTPGPGGHGAAIGPRKAGGPRSALPGRTRGNLR
jgi:O-antigen ligase